MMRKLLLAAIAATMVPVASATPPTDADRAALTRIAQQLDVVWDDGDPAAVSAFYAVDGTLRLEDRPLVEGRAAVQRYFEETIGRRPAGARHVTDIEHIDMLTPDLAFVDVQARIERESAQGGREVLMRFHNQTLATRQGGEWLFRAVRAQRVAPPMRAAQAPQAGASR